MGVILTITTYPSWDDHPPSSPHPHWIQTREKITSKDLRSSITRSVRAAFCTDAEEAEASGEVDVPLEVRING